jgi:hypothetical protein
MRPVVHHWDVWITAVVTVLFETSRAGTKILRIVYFGT